MKKKTEMIRLCDCESLHQICPMDYVNAQACILQ